MSDIQTPEAAGFSIERGESPLVAAAIHDGHAVRSELDQWFALNSSQRLHEEDPFTGGWTAVAPTSIIGTHSRFEVDLNRPRDKAVYQRPEDAWGLRVWNTELPSETINQSLAKYDAFYSEVGQLFIDLEAKFGHFVVFDLHSYNHRRDGVLADSAKNPEVNIGSGTVNRAIWGPLLDRFMADLRTFDFLGGKLNVRENVKFQGGEFSRWTHRNFPSSGCAIAIEWKKFFMDECSGEPDVASIRAIQAALESTVPGILEELAKL